MFIRGLLLSLGGLLLVLYLWLSPVSRLTTSEPLVLPSQQHEIHQLSSIVASASVSDTVASAERAALPPESEDMRDTYCLWPDDTLGDIAAAANVSVEAILAENPDFSGYAGSAIFLPKGSIPPYLWTTPKPAVPTIEQLPFGVSGYYIGYDNRAKRVALSFDIGYVPENHELMRWLAEQGIHATFLVIGDPISRYPEVIDQILSNGHEVGNHSYTHDNMLTHSKDDVRGELNLTEKVVRDAYPGATTKPLFRAPFGAISPAIVQIAAQEGYRVIGWTIDSRDWNEGITAEQIYTHVTQSMCPGAIIAMHDVNPESKIALPRIIDFLRRRNYTFVTVSEMIFPPQDG
ncbi:MAG: polysaccharide deacetylase family protein [Caldilineaceae bacterium]|nr:polysaccharide deacetylase family protein [Caldilineaceae bacterium]